ncbi:hypothetical protein ACFE04_016701 [Oxalis oulophora]
MMFHASGSSRNHCSLLAVISSKTTTKTTDDDDDIKHKQLLSDNLPTYPFPELVSSGRLEVQVLTNPSADEFQRVLESTQPNIVYFKGEQAFDSEEIGSLVFRDIELSNPDSLCRLFCNTLPTTVYLEVPNGEKLAEALHSKGIPYVIYWKHAFSCYAASHFCHSLFSVVQSLYCTRNNHVLPSDDSIKAGLKVEPHLLGDPPKIDVVMPEIDAEEEENSSDFTAIKIFDEDVNMRFLVCGMPCTLDSDLLGPLEDGLNALLRIEMRGCKLHSRASATLPPLQAGTFNRGVVTMKCDISTCSSAHTSLLVSGSPQTCFNDQILEDHIKNEVIENIPLVHALPCPEESKYSSEPRKSASIACGASVFEVSLKVPTWASQVLRQLAPEASYRSLVMLGIASIQGLSVASFEKDDAERFCFLCKHQEKEQDKKIPVLGNPPSWLVPPAPRQKRFEPCRDTRRLENGSNGKPKLNIAAMRPIPHTQRHKLLPFSRLLEGERYDRDQVKPELPTAPVKHGNAGPTPAAHRKSTSNAFRAQQIISLNPLPLKKHGCSRAHIQDCSEEEFLRDVMHFLILRGHTRLVPHGGLAEFPDAILNAKRLDLFNLYREVVSRGGFHVGNGINWKGQVFSKMRNHTLTNRMTGVGNTLKRHYETYLLEYELAHDDVDGECCLLCHSSAAGDWVNCGTCGEWAHFGCDRRQGLGAFKDYAKTDGLEYLCPNCSVNIKKKSQKTGNGY